MEYLESVLKFLKRYPLAIIGLIAILIGANTFSFWHVMIADSAWRWMLAIVGAVFILINIFLIIKEQPNLNDPLNRNYGIEINSPQQGERLFSPILLTGKYKKKPPEGLLYAFEFNPTTYQYYAKSEVVYQAGTDRWQCTVHVGGGDDKTRIIKIVAVGKHAKYFIDYYNKVVNDTNHTYYIGVKKLPEDTKVLGEISIWLKKVV